VDDALAVLVVPVLASPVVPVLGPPVVASPVVSPAGKLVPVVSAAPVEALAAVVVAPALEVGSDDPVLDDEPPVAESGSRPKVVHSHAGARDPPMMNHGHTRDRIEPLADERMLCQHTMVAV
jgi:hypothetical protein